ncbi:hypothetical protein tb265_46850 [Gemmatimonadetes bacterium T265]|nr:hypothetical protein tb265_46850 [Gemmatimonadetes bacterium T265]
MTFRLPHSRRDEAPIPVPAIGLELRVRLPGAVSRGVCTIIETTNARGFGPPLHRHREVEVFHVLEGRYLFEVDGERFHADVGDVVAVPGGAARAFVNVTDRPARQFILILPALDAVAFFTGPAEVMAGGPADQTARQAFGRQWGVEFLGPPLAATG